MIRYVIPLQHEPYSVCHQARFHLGATSDDIAFVDGVTSMSQSLAIRALLALL